MNWNPYTLEELENPLKGLDNWFIDGGYSLELLLSKKTRVHDDIDIGIFSTDAKSFLKNLLGLGYAIYVAHKD